MDNVKNVVYIWLDSDDGFRSKVRNISEIPEDERFKTVKNWELWRWACDGSSTCQASTENSELILEPYCAYYGENQMWVLCHMLADLFGNKKFSHLKNSYYYFVSKFKERIESSGLKLGFEQEFFIYDNRTKLLYKDKKLKEEMKEQYYCSVGSSGNGYIEDFVKEIYERACTLGVHCTGWNLEVCPAQGEIQVCTTAIQACHDLTFLRYLIWDTLKKYDLYPNLHPKPLGPSWNGSGLHTNISTHKTMDSTSTEIIETWREEGQIVKKGYLEIEKLIRLFRNSHKTHIADYGKHNELRLTGIHETSSMDIFSSGVGSRSTSVRIPINTHQKGYGYFEDRRPAANADPYRVCLRIWNTIMEDEDFVL